MKYRIVVVTSTEGLSERYLSVLDDYTSEGLLKLKRELYNKIEDSAPLVLESHINGYIIIPPKVLATSVIHIVAEEG